VIVLDLIDPQWILGDADDPNDQCAHGFIEFAVDDVQFVTKGDGTWTVSAAALFLLRTITSDHSNENSVAEENDLIPCCGQWICQLEAGRHPYTVMSCGAPGIDPSIIHRGSLVEISLDEKSASVSVKDWAAAILGFVGQVQEFYDRSSPKKAIEDDLDREGWKYF
jgi:hypothetical protein